MLIKDTLKLAVLSWLIIKSIVFYENIFGYNQYDIGRFNGSYNESLHAEIDAMNKLSYNKSRKLIKINLFVFRVNRRCNIMNAKCCDNCIHGIYRIAKIKGYIIKKIYYTDENNNIQIYK